MPEAVQSEKLEVDMEVVRDVMHGGALLIQAGTILTAQLITSIQRREIEEVIVSCKDDKLRKHTDKITDILSEARGNMSKGATDKFEKMLVRIDAMFFGLEEDVVMGPLKLAAVIHWKNSYNEEHADS